MQFHILLPAQGRARPGFFVFSERIFADEWTGREDGSVSYTPRVGAPEAYRATGGRALDGIALVGRTERGMRPHAPAGQGRVAAHPCLLKDQALDVDPSQRAIFPQAILSTRPMRRDAARCSEGSR